ncbi:ADOP family duplicated permease [Telmatobacter bradus]|uniref:ABC transporter permease n=1 Tax=Telmatobacter bradus TaxID=474953 RepID=UPI003B433C8C
MRVWEQLRVSLRMLFHRGRAAEQLDEELRYHLDCQTEENLAAGMNAREAREAALRSFGNPALLRDQARSSWHWNWLEALLRDLRYGVRALRHAPGFAGIAILVMALGIGANVAIFAVVRNLLLRPLPYPEQQRLMAAYENSSDQFPENSVAGGIFDEWTRQNKSFTSLAMTGEAKMNLSTADGELPEELVGIACTANLLPTLGVTPTLGRNFTAAEDQPGANRVVLLSWSLYKRRFNANPAIVNRQVYIDKQPYTVIGVMPAWFAFPDQTIQAWTPFRRYYPTKEWTSLGAHDYGAVGRLRDGVSMAQAQGDLSRITKQIHDAHLDDPFVSRGATLKSLLEDTVGDMRKTLYVLLAATGCVLLIACLNVANLLVARAAARRKEAAIRTALGGGRLQLLRERLVESFLLSLAGGIAGVILAWLAVTWIRLNLSRLEVMRADLIQIDAATLAFTVGLIALCALFAGLIASFSAMSRQPLAELQDSSRGMSASRGRTRLRRALLAVEVGLTVVLLVAAGLFLKSYQRLRSSNLGCITQNVLTIRFGLYGGSYRDPAARVQFYRTLLERVRALPGVESAGFGRAVPGQGYWGDGEFTIVEHPPLPQGTAQFAINRVADAQFFTTLGIPLLRGRNFDDNLTLDHANQTLINAAFAKQYFPGEEPIGKHLKFGQKTWQIVGIVGDTRATLDDDPRPVQYYPLFAGDENGGRLVVRSSGDVERFVLPIQRIVQSIDRDLPTTNIMTMEQMLQRKTLAQRCSTVPLLAFGVLTLLLAAVGLFGVLSYLVAQRRGEIGIRLALGATRTQVLRRMMVDGLKPALAGLVLGLAASVAAVRLIRSMLFDTQSLDPVIFAGVPLLLLAVAVLACLLPSWRAARLNPVEALRTE